MQIEIDGKYTSKNGNKWRCIHIEGEHAWLVGTECKTSPAYVFKVTGENVSQAIDLAYDIVFPPKMETVTETAFLKKYGVNGGWYLVDMGRRDSIKGTLTTTLQDGKPVRAVWEADQ